MSGCSWRGLRRIAVRRTVPVPPPPNGYTFPMVKVPAWVTKSVAFMGSLPVGSELTRDRQPRLRGTVFFLSWPVPGHAEEALIAALACAASSKPRPGIQRASWCCHCATRRGRATPGVSPGRRAQPTPAPWERPNGTLENPPSSPLRLTIAPGHGHDLGRQTASCADFVMKSRPRGTAPASRGTGRAQGPQPAKRA